MGGARKPICEFAVFVDLVTAALNCGRDDDRFALESAALGSRSAPVATLRNAELARGSGSERFPVDDARDRGTETNF